MITASTSWENKAHRIISSLCFEAWRAANTKSNGEKYKRHRPYSVPELAQSLVNCLDMADRKEAEIQAKTLFLSYEGMMAI